MFASLSTSRHRLARWLIVLAGALVLGWLTLTYVSMPVAPATAPADPPAPPWPEPARPADDAWAVLQQQPGVSVPQGGPLAGRFRLAGTFFAFGESPEDSSGTSRRAIVDDIGKSTQYLVREGDVIAEFTVSRIDPDRVTLQSDGVEEELLLSFASETGPGAAQERPATPVGGDTETILETSRFGKRVGKTRWVFKDAALREYYQEVLDDPERLASLYLSMKPDYEEDAIEGYYLDVEGEADFFKTIGLEAGDTIRRVNSMKMTSQGRAEYFIREFIKGRLGAVVLDIDRQGGKEKLIYLIRP